MSTEPLPSEPREPKEIRDFRVKYEEALGHARVSEEHTATEGWQNLYDLHRVTIRTHQDALADRMELVVQTLRQRLLTEDEEKAVVEAKKEMTELRIREQAFQRQVIDPIIAPMVQC